MKIKKLFDGSTKVDFENGNTFYVKKGIDPIDGMIDIGLIQQKTASFIDKPTTYDEYVMPLRFLYVLGRRCFETIKEYAIDMAWHKYVAQEFNSEITRQQAHRAFNDLDTDEILDFERYEICYLDILPEIVSKPSEHILVNTSSDSDSEIQISKKDDTEYLVALSLLRLLHSGLDIRKIENRISELKGLSEYLKLISSDAYYSYCTVADRLGLDIELDVSVYYELMEQIMQE